MGLNDTIDLMFMRVSHTRCFVDGGFGLVKQKYLKTDFDTVSQLRSSQQLCCIQHTTAIPMAVVSVE